MLFGVSYRMQLSQLLKLNYRITHKVTINFWSFYLSALEIDFDSSSYDIICLVYFVISFIFTIEIMFLVNIYV